MGVSRSIVRSIVGSIVSSVAGAIASRVKDLFNAFNADSTFTGPDTITTDYLGVLQVSTDTRGAIKGGRFSAGDWFDDDGSGNSLQPYKLVAGDKQWIYHATATINTAVAVGDFRSAIASDGTERYYTIATGDDGTTGGALPVFPTSGQVADGTATWTLAGWHTIGGYVDEEARTNKITNRKANPVDTSGLTKGGDAASTLTVVDDTAELLVAGLDKICNSGQVYKLDNSVGVAFAYAIFGGAVGVLTPHSAGVFARGDGVLYIQGVAQNVVFNSPVYVRHKLENKTPDLTFRQAGVQCAPGDVAYFILTQLEEGAFSTSPIAFDSNGDDVLAAVTRPATNLTRSTSTWPNLVGGVSNDFALQWRVEAEGAGQTGYIAGIDSVTATGISTTATTVVFNKDGVDTPITFTHQAGVGFEGQLILTTATGTHLAVKEDGGAWSAWTVDASANGKLDANIDTDYQVCGRGDAEHFNAYCPNFEVIDLTGIADPETFMEDRR